MTIETERKNIIKSILNVRCRDGATIFDIENDYMELVGNPLPDLLNCLRSIDGVYCAANPGGEPKWYVNSSNTEHIKHFILQQKIPQPPKYNRSKKPEALNHLVKGDDCFFKDNIVYKHMRQYKQYQNQRQDSCNNSFDSYKHIPKQISPKPSPKPTLHAQLVGDDFFLSLAREATSLNRKDGVQQAGLCVSGLSIQAAAKLIELTPYFKSTKLIINIGSVDILHGHDLVEMCFDFESLINMCESRKLEPIIATLAPLANSSHLPDMLEKLRRFNVFILEKYFTQYQIIDIWSKLTNPRGATNFAYFQSESNYVSGSNRPHVLWSSAGRKLIRNHIHWCLSRKLHISMEHMQIDA